MHLDPREADLTIPTSEASRIRDSIDVVVFPSQSKYTAVSAATGRVELSHQVLDRDFVHQKQLFVVCPNRGGGSTGRCLCREVLISKMLLKKFIWLRAEQAKGKPQTASAPAAASSKASASTNTSTKDQGDDWLTALFPGAAAPPVPISTAPTTPVVEAKPVNFEYGLNRILHKLAAAQCRAIPDLTMGSGGVDGDAVGDAVGGAAVDVAGVDADAFTATGLTADKSNGNSKPFCASAHVSFGDEYCKKVASATALKLAENQNKQVDVVTYEHTTKRFITRINTHALNSVH